MLKLLNTLSDKIKSKNIYIWNVDKDSITEFTKLALRQIDVKGFVTQEQMYIGEYYMNRPVMDVEEALHDQNAIIILSERCDRSKISEEINQKAFLLSELLQIDEALQRKTVYIYGAGSGAKSIYTDLEESGINIEAFCVSHQGDGIATCMERKVYQIDEITQSDSNVFVISALKKQYHQEMVDRLSSLGANMYIRDFLNDDILLVISLFQSIHKAWSEKRKIYVYTRTVGGYFLLIKNTLKLYGIEISGCVYKESNKELDIQNVYELAYERIDDIFVLVNDLDILERKEQIEVYQILECLGFSVSAFNYAGFRPITTNDWNGCDQNTPDPLLGWSMVYDDKNLPGVKVIGTQEKDDIRIVVLGGSTSTDGILRATSWVRLLYQKLVLLGQKVTIYDCAGAGEDVLQELLRLIRDGVHLKPQYVISMSGVNNRGHMIRGVKNKANLKHTVEWYRILSPNALCVCGLPIREEAFSYWLRIQKIIKAVAELNGSKYFCYLQPIKEAKEKLSIFEKSVHFSGDADNEAESFRKKARDDDFYVNLLSLFDEKEEMFTDICHYSEEANEILADIVCKDLQKNLTAVSVINEKIE